ncbi:NAD-dependent epimerase/dehydratase family protein [Maritalea myrionectae]|uniref:NAD-dependent epimerase/dehydratase family protein n=1 Tax=Maritalea myrionectae TaxID=454601 RepID=UPI0004262818|nr:NAD(P)-dependent oxidoreductase [Maritalea myrionectae]
MHLLVTGASGKLGSRVIKKLLDQPQQDALKITAVTFSRDLPFSDERMTVRRGNIADRPFVADIMQGVTHVLHMATCKEMPEIIMDVTVKGMFWLLEEFRAQQGQYFALVGGDAAIGHYFYPTSAPITESYPHKAAPGCYSLSKVLEEVMLAQAHIQYGIQGCCLRAPWLVADDDLRFAMSFSKQVFGSPRWHEYFDDSTAEKFTKNQNVPLALGAQGKPLQRSILAVDDLVNAIIKALNIQPAGCETFNIAMDKPFDYGVAAKYLNANFGLEAVDVQTEFHSVWLDNSKARQHLSWRPAFDTEALLEQAWAFDREGSERAEIVYPG